MVTLGRQLLQRIESLHHIGYVHRDLKPRNIMFDRESKQLYLIDFGLCNKYLTEFHSHIRYTNTEKLLGTPLFASNNALQGKELS